MSGMMSGMMSGSMATGSGILTAGALQAGGPAAEPNPLFSLVIPMGLVLVIFYFLLIRPANKKQKALQAMIGNLKNGDQIITTGGIHGVVAGIDDEVIHLKVAQGVKIEISRNAVASMKSTESRSTEEA